MKVFMKNGHIIDIDTPFKLIPENNVIIFDEDEDSGAFSFIPLTDIKEITDSNNNSVLSTIPAEWCNGPW